MATILSNPTNIVVDASFALAHVLQEPGRFPLTDSYFKAKAAAGCSFFAPGVFVAETLYVLCDKLLGKTTSITPAQHATALAALVAHKAIQPVLCG